MPDEQSIDCRPEDPLQRMKVEVFRRVIDQITTSIDERFSVNHPLIRDTACLDPRRFKEIVSDGIPRGSLDFIAKCITLSVTDLQDELVSFARDFESLSRILRQEFQDVQTTDQLASSIESESDTASGSECEKSDPSDTDEEACDLLVRNKVACTGCCRTCLLCCYRILNKYSLNATTYSNLFQAYEYLLTLSFTQISCERAFSKLKIVKTRLRSSMGNDKLEAFMLMSTEQDILDTITVDDIISRLAADSVVFSKLLVV